MTKPLYGDGGVRPEQRTRQGVRAIGRLLHGILVVSPLLTQLVLCIWIGIRKQELSPDDKDVLLSIGWVVLMVGYVFLAWAYSVAVGRLRMRKEDSVA